MAPEILQIQAIVAGGDGLARRPDGPVVFVPRTAPGERVEVEYTETRRQWARARVTRILEASPDRRDPLCPYYERCGGCQLQHLSYRAQLHAKSRIVAEGLRRLGGLEIDPPDVVPAESEFEYRNRVSFVVRRAPAGVSAGYHALDAPDQIVDVERCPLAEPALNRVWAELRAGWGPGARRLPGGRELRLTVRATAAGEVGLALEGGEGLGEPNELLESVAGLSAIWSVDDAGAVDWYAGAPVLADRWGTHEIVIAGTAFLQVNREVAAKLEDYVRAQCGDVSGLRVIDAYCGFGFRALELSWAGARVVGIDADHGAISVARSAAAESGAAARFHAHEVERALAWELPVELVLLNPPRRGLGAEVVGALLKEPPARVIYVSCDPATLARDLKGLAELYHIVACRCFDMFPQTVHVETVVTLERSGSP